MLYSNDPALPLLLLFDLDRGHIREMRLGKHGPLVPISRQ